MKKYLAILAIVFAPMTFAATTGTLGLSGIIPTILAIVVSPETVSSSLDLTTTQSDLLVAQVGELSNSATGYKILLSSANSGKLVRSGGTEFISYTAKYDASAATLSTTPTSVKSVASAGVHVDSSDFKISYTGSAADSLVAGTYSDTLTFTIQAN